MLNGVHYVRYLSQNIAFQELLAGNDQQITFTGQVSSSIHRRIVSFSVILWLLSYLTYLQPIKILALLILGGSLQNRLRRRTRLIWVHLENTAVEWKKW